MSTTWDGADWAVLIGGIIFMILFVGFATGYPQSVWSSRKKKPDYGTVPGIPDPIGVPSMQDRADDMSEDPQPDLETYTFFLNGDPLCVAQWVDTEDGFWEFSNDEPDEMVMLYMPRPGDTLTAEPRGDI